MNRNEQWKPQDRSRSLRRLRNITIGTATLGVVAAGSFGALAAFSTTANAAALTADAATTTDQSATTTTDTGTSLFGSAPSVSSSSGRGHASSGGS
jgi:hypothetical protein